jgi:hypothetical protein
MEPSVVVAIVVFGEDVDLPELQQEILDADCDARRVWTLRPYGDIK